MADTLDKLETLKKIARAATPGPWRAGSKTVAPRAPLMHAPTRSELVIQLIAPWRTSAWLGATPHSLMEGADGVSELTPNKMRQHNLGSMPIDLAKLLETRMLVQANSGAGKSWTLRRILEQTAAVGALSGIGVARYPTKGSVGLTSIFEGL